MKNKLFDLKHPIEIEGKAPIQQVSVLRPKWKHFKRFLSSTAMFEESDLLGLEVDKILALQETQAEAMHVLIRDLCQLTDEQIEELDAEDMEVISEYIEKFQKKFQKTGSKS